MLSIKIKAFLFVTIILSSVFCVDYLNASQEHSSNNPRYLIFVRQIPGKDYVIVDRLADTKDQILEFSNKQEMYKKYYNLNKNLPSYLKGRVDFNCFTCGEKGSLVCKNCQFARYCSLDCQRTGWKNHKPYCKPAVSSPGQDSIKTSDMRIYELIKDIDETIADIDETSEIRREALKALRLLSAPVVDGSTGNPFTPLEVASGVPKKIMKIEAPSDLPGLISVSSVSAGAEKTLEEEPIYSRYINDVD
jgi:hypothetical protein